jgi:hypothetical protein
MSATPTGDRSTDDSSPTDDSSAGKASFERRSLRAIRQMESRTDWERLRQMTDDEIEAAAREDPGSPLLDDEWLRAARLVAPIGANE